jgi:hypothetical protein
MLYLGVHHDLLNACHFVVAALVSSRPLKLPGTRPVFGSAIAGLRDVLRADYYRHETQRCDCESGDIVVFRCIVQIQATLPISKHGTLTDASSQTRGISLVEAEAPNPLGAC